MEPLKPLALDNKTPFGDLLDDLSDPQALGEEEVAVLFSSLPLEENSSGESRLILSQGPEFRPDISSGEEPHPFCEESMENRASIVSVSPQDTPQPGELQYDPELEGLGYKDRQKFDRIGIVYSKPVLRFSHRARPLCFRLKEDMELRPWWVPSMQPFVAGEWRFSEPEILVFEPFQSFAAATTYRFTSSCGGTWTVSTEAPQFVLSSFPHETDLLPIIEVRCQYPVHWASQTQHIWLFDQEDQAVDVEFVDDSIDENGAFLGRYRPHRPLNPDAPYGVTCLAGMKAAEAPNPSPSDSDVVFFRTRGPFELLDVSAELCEQAKQIWEKSPHWRICLEFSCQLDSADFGFEDLHFEEALQDMSLSFSGPRLVCRGRSPGGDHLISVGKSLRDRYGRSLELADPLPIRLIQPPNIFYPAGKYGAMPNLNPKTYRFLSVSNSAIFVRIYRVKPEHWPGYLDFVQACEEAEPAAPVYPDFLEEGVTELITIAAPLKASEVVVDLTPYVKKHGGNVVVQARPALPAELACYRGSYKLSLDEIRSNWRFYVWPRGQAPSRPWLQTVWLQFSSLSLSVFMNYQKMTVRAVDGVEGRVITKLEHRVVHGRGPDEKEQAKKSYLIGKFGESHAFLAHGGCVGTPPKSLEAYVFTDRFLYSAGERLRLKARFWEQDLLGPSPRSLEGGAVEYTLRDSSGQEIVKGRATLSDHQSLDLDFDLPSDLELGFGSILFQMGELSSLKKEVFRIANFRSPSHEVDIRFLGLDTGDNSVHYLVSARTRLGAALSGARIEVGLERIKSSFTYPGWPDYIFGSDEETWSQETGLSHPLTLLLDESGERQVQIPLPVTEELQSYLHHFQARLLDPELESQVAVDQRLHSVGHYSIGLRVPKRLLADSEDVELEFLVLDRLNQVCEDVMVEIRVNEEQSHCLSSTLKPQSLKISCRETSGELLLKAQVRDDQGRASFTQLRLFRETAPPAIQSGLLSISLDREIYPVEARASLTITCPHRGTAFVRVSNGGQVHYSEHYLSQGSHTLAIPVVTEMLPESLIQVDFVGPIKPDHVRVYRAQTHFRVDTNPTRLWLDVNIQGTWIEPNQDVKLSIEVRNWFGRPEPQAEVTFVAVREDVLLAGGYKIPEPSSALFSRRGQSGHRSHHVFSQVDEVPQYYARGARSRKISVEERETAASAPFMSPYLSKPTERAVVFFPTLKTDDQGRVEASFNLGEELGAYRLTAVAFTHDRRHGYQEALLHMKRPLALEVALPDFLRVGDESEFVIKVRSSSERTFPLRVALRGEGFKQLGAPGYGFDLGPRASCVLTFPVEVLHTKALRVDAVLHGEDHKQRVRREIPVYPSTISKRVVFVGSMGEETRQISVAEMMGSSARSGSMDLVVSNRSTLLLEEAYRFLVRRPPLSTEQLVARIVCTARLHSSAQELEWEDLPDSEQAEARMKVWVEEILRRATDEGFTNWFAGEVEPLTSLSALHALSLAQKMGFDVLDFEPEEAWFLLDVQRLEPRDRGGLIDGYRVWLLTRWEAPDAQFALDSFEPKNLDGWLWYLRCLTEPSKIAAGLSEIKGRLTDSQSPKMNLTTRQKAWALSALCEVNGGRELMVELENELQISCSGGTWGGYLDTAFVILALSAADDILDRKLYPGKGMFSLEDGRLLDSEFLEDTSSRQGVVVPLTGALHELTLTHKGEGSLYYRVTAQSNLDSAELELETQNFYLSKDIVSVSGYPKILVEQDGEIRLTLGARYEVRICVECDSEHDELLITDPIPAGCVLVGSPGAEEAEAWSFCGAIHREPHHYHELVTYLHEGVFEIRYQMEARTKGVYQLLPTLLGKLSQPGWLASGLGGRVSIGAYNS